MNEPLRAFLRNLIVCLAVALALANAGLALVFPLEIERREGTSWLHVLASVSDTSIYDESRVAFLNMNHGPVDPMLKTIAARIAPLLPAAVVTRVFVLLLPFAIFLAIWSAAGSGFFAFGLSVAIYLLLLGLQPPYFLVGRSDPCAMCFFSFLLAARLYGIRLGWRGLARNFFCAALGWTVILANWRFLPAVLIVEIGFACDDFFGAQAHLRLARLVRKILIFSLVGVSFLGAIVVSEFHGDLLAYYRHFFGFFSKDSGWGALTEGSFILFPRALLWTHWAMHATALLGLAIVTAFPSRHLSRRLQLSVWLPLLAALWASCSAAYYLNHSGGGLYYFGVFYVVLGFHLARAGNWEHLRERLWCDALFVGVFISLPWIAVFQQVVNFATSMRPAFTFLSEVERITRGNYVYSEDFYFFKRRYEGEVVDMGDVVSQVSATGYFGSQFARTVQLHHARLTAHPPLFIMSGGLGSPELKNMLTNDYNPILRAPPHLWPYAGPSATLYRRR